MKRELHIIANGKRGLREEIRSRSAEAVIFDLSVREPDYRALLEQIFEAEQVSVWSSDELG